MDLSNISKAIGGGVAGLLIAELARYGFHPAPVYTDALGLLVTGLVGYLAGHVIVYLSPANKPSTLGGLK
jgi:hypothetical protein